MSSRGKTCRKCGEKSSSDARFCGYCGKIFPGTNLMSLIPEAITKNFTNKEIDVTAPEGASGVEIDKDYQEIVEGLTWGTIEEIAEKREVIIKEPPLAEVKTEIVEADDNVDWKPSPWKLRVFIGLLGAVILLGVVGYVIWESSLDDPALAVASNRTASRFPRPPRNLVLKQPTYQGSVNNIFREGQRLWWQSDYFACVAVFGEDVGPTFIPGRLIRQGEWRGWQFAELRGGGDRFLFLSVCGTGWNTYISEIPPDIPEHLGQAVVQDGIRAYYRAPP